MKYYIQYDNLSNVRPFVEADADESAIQKVKEIAGEHLIGINAIWYEFESKNITIWME